MGFMDGARASMRQGLTEVSHTVTRITAAVTGSAVLPTVVAPPDQAASIADVLVRMRSLAATMPASDGVGDFHRMYLHVTELVEVAKEARTFRDPEFMERLDCVFAGLYLDACRAADQTRSTAWQPLFALRAQPGTESIQFALAGMNAHINFDLALALVRTCRQLGRTLDSPGIRADFLAINGILAGAVQGVRESYLAGLALEVDREAAPVLDVVNAWSIDAARDAAWVSATLQWTLQDRADLYAGYLAAHSAMVGFITRQLLTPVGVTATGVGS